MEDGLEDEHAQSNPPLASHILETRGFSEWDKDEDETDDEEADAEINNDTKLRIFSQTLQQAQDAAATAEQEINLG